MRFSGIAFPVALFVLCLVLPMGCRSSKDPLEAPPVNGSHWWHRANARTDTSAMAQNWLAANQNKDGSWGSGDRRILLTSLATLAFLSRGETTASKEYGEAIQKALRRLILEAGELENQPPKDPRTRAALTWCLSEAYSLTRIPVMRTTLLQLPRLNQDDPVPWRVIAAKSVIFSGADTNFTKEAFLALCPPVDFQATNGFDRVVASLICRESGRWKEARTLAPPLESTNDWKHSDAPFMHAYLLQYAFYDMGETSYVKWYRTFFPEIIRSQKVRWNRGWWTPEALGLGPNKETAGMTKADAALYATCWMMLCEPPRRWLPTYHKPEKTEPDDAADDIKIEIL